MNSNLKKYAQKWPSWRIDKSDEKAVDFSECSFVGEGRHEVVAYSFARYCDSTENTYPICIRFGIHFPDYLPLEACLLYTSPSPRDKRQSRMPSSA